MSSWGESRVRVELRRNQLLLDNSSVLIVDDQEHTRRLLVRSLERSGHRCATAESADAASDILRQDEFEILLLDIMMPGRSGMDFLPDVVAQYPDIAVLMMTAVTETQTAVDAMKAGAYDYVTKPFNLDDVALRVRRAREVKTVRMLKQEAQQRLERELGEKTRQMQEQFAQLVQSMAREHRLLYGLNSERGGKAALSSLPPELQERLSSVELFRDALLRILGRGRV